jgi:hypothetical protein
MYTYLFLKTMIEKNGREVVEKMGNNKEPKILRTRTSHI